ncbi:uncharacterized protein [Littorina saxatilis]|uniref:uncharacterized protein n=1 Tax=Littorina saxatilis TaxID=31220 RepID=UPI0038B42043
MWPLDDVTGGYDIMAGSPSLTSLMTRTCFRTDSSSPDVSLAKSFLLFDGSLDSTVKMEVESSAWDDDFTVVVFVKPQQPPEGLIWTYSSPQASLGISRIEVSLRYDGSLVMTVWDSGLHAPCGQIVAPELFNNVSKFSTVIVGRNASAVKLQVDDNVWVGNNSCPKSTGNAGQGLMEVGGRGEGQSAGYRGHAVCMAVFSQYVSTLDDVQLLTQCGDYDPAPYLGVKACNPTAEMRTELFKLFARNKAPDVTRFPPMTSFQTSSAVKCGSCCMRTQHCKSFTFSSDAVTSSCSLFDFVTLTGLGDSKGNYYEVTSD